MHGVAELQALLRVSNDRAMSRLTSKLIREFPLGLGEAEGQEYWKDCGLRDVKSRSCCRMERRPVKKCLPKFLLLLGRRLDHGQS
jgi:hypothetical protein